MDVDPPGRQLVACGPHAAAVRLLDSGEVVASLEGIGTTLTPCGPFAFDAGGRTVQGFAAPASAWGAVPPVRRRDDVPFDGVLATWDAASGARVREMPCRAARLLAFSADRRRALVADASGVTAWDLENGAAAGRIENVDREDARSRLYAFSGAFLSGSLVVLARARFRDEGPPRPVHLEVVDLATSAVLRRVPSSAHDPSLASTPDGKGILTSTNGKVYLVVPETLNGGAVAEGRRFALLPGATRFAAWTGGAIRVADFAGATIASFDADEPSAVVATPDGRTVLGGDMAGWLSVHAPDGARIAGSERLAGFRGVRIWQMGGRTTIEGTRDEAPALHVDAETFADAPPRPPEPAVTDPDAYRPKISPDGRWALRTILAANGHRVSVTDTRSGSVAVEPADELRVVNRVAFGPGLSVVSGTFLEDIVCWTLDTFEVTRRLEGLPGGALEELSWSPDGRWIAAGDDYGRILAWEAETGRRVSVRARDERSVTALAAGPGNRIAFAVRDERDVTVWDLAAGSAVATLTGHTATVTGAAFLPDGRLVTVGDDGRALVHPPLA